MRIGHQVSMLNGDHGMCVQHKGHQHALVRWQAALDLVEEAIKVGQLRHTTLSTGEG